jgi:outer membrane protein assembly factor BamB
MFLKTLLLLVATVLLASCGIFKDDDDKALEPMELVPIDNKLKLRKAWSAKLGGGAEFLRIALRPAGDGSRLFAASHNGRVYAFDAMSGKQLWRTDVETPLSAGPSFGNDSVAVVSSDGWLILLDADDGAEKWRSNVSAESLAAPVIKGDIVVVQTIDNRLQGFSLFEGAVRWSVEQATPALSMRGSSSPALVGNTVIAGFDNGRMAAVDIESGDVVWESLLSPPTGRSDLDRLSDIDGAIAAVGQDVYAAGYNGRLASIAAESGQVLWAREISSYEGVSVDWNNVYTTRDNGEILSLTRRDGTEEWRDASLLRREPTLPVPFDTTVVVGDLDGYLHFFSNVDGEPVARVKLGGAAITSAPVVMGQRLYVQTDGGVLASYEVQRPVTKPTAPATADDGS